MTVGPISTSSGKSAVSSNLKIDIDFSTVNVLLNPYISEDVTVV